MAKSKWKTKSKYQRIVLDHLFLLGADLTFFRYSRLLAILKQSSTFRWSFLLPYFRTAALASFYGKLIPTLSAAFMMYSKDSFPSGLHTFLYTLLIASSESGFPFSWWVFYPRYWVNFCPSTNFPSENRLTKGWVASKGFLENVFVNPVRKETGTLFLNLLLTKLTASWEIDG